jgi:hypothetical protein
MYRCTVVGFPEWRGGLEVFDIFLGQIIIIFDVVRTTCSRECPVFVFNFTYTNNLKL